ncbi:MAG: A/G-specific adenine glycosylase, partial [Bacteroidota bacterium]
SYKHVLSHKKIYARFWKIECAKSFDKLLPKTAITIKENAIHKYAVPRLIENYLAALSPRPNE